jgi:hypothetical protein
MESDFGKSSLVWDGGEKSIRNSIREIPEHYSDSRLDARAREPKNKSASRELVSNIFWRPHDKRIEDCI